MATDRKFIEYVCDQMRGAGDITSRKMFGEYAVYCGEKVVALVCDNQVFVKPTPEGRAELGTVTEGFPFPGARPFFLIDDGLEDAEALARLIAITARALPAPKPKAKARPQAATRQPKLKR